MTVRELEQRMDAQELAEWRWVFTIEHEEREGRKGGSGRRRRPGGTKGKARGTDTDGDTDADTSPGGVTDGD